MSAGCNLRVCATWVSLPAVVLLALAAADYAGAASPPPDATLFTTFSASTGYQNIYWVVCGSTQDSEGCYDAGSLGPFGRAGAIIEGTPSVDGTAVTRDIYVIDVEAGESGKDVRLFVYRKTDSVSASTDSVTVVLAKSEILPLIGGPKATAFLAANASFLYVGTDQSQVALRILKSTFSMNQLGGFSPPINLSAITTDSYGNVTITFGDFTSGENGFYQFDAQGRSLGDGGGADFMLNTVSGLSTATLPTGDPSALASRLGVRAKLAQP